MAADVCPRKEPGPRFNIKMISYQYRKSHCGDKTILRPSYLHNGISYTGKMSSLYWIRAQGISNHVIDLVLLDYSGFSTRWFNPLKPRQNGCHFPDDIFKCIFLNENVPISFGPKGLINNIPALVQIMAWRRPGDKPFSEPLMIILPTHICVTQPQWVKGTHKAICIH